MKTKNLVTVVLGIIGTLLLGVGMSLVLVPEFNLLVVGIVVGAIGLVALLSILPLWIKPKKVSFGLVLTYIVGIAGALVFGYGLTEVLTEEVLAVNDLVKGLLWGVPGLLIMAVNPLVYTQIKAAHNGKKEIQNI